MPQSVLEATGISVRFGGLAALSDVGLRLRQGEILGLIGPNGAGKTTLINVLSGFQPPTAGVQRLDGIDITHVPAYRRARLGIARSFQAVRIFPDLTVLENVAVSAATRGAGRAEARRHARDVLAWVGIGHREMQPGSALPYAEERLVGIARALALKPRHLLLDEPAAGMNDAEIEEFLGRITAIPRDFGCGVLLVEHNMRLVMAVAERIQVLEFGQTIAEGDPAAIRADARVVEAYLGAESAEA